ncbi:MAG: hypothetical protein J3K34DRAFT_434807 [Monoraphidium minutum]|nr:MAG: hypothetical protein J3K34DRAFT_434807 [Monoraphidium minutum]
MISDHSLHSRLAVHVPVASAEQLSDSRVQIRYCPAAKRDVAVLLEPGEEDEGTGLDWAAGRCGGEAEAQAEQLRAKMGQLLGRSLRVDRETALFYIDCAGGDVKRAVAEAERDAAWEEGTAGPMRTAPVQRWIAGEAGL